ncbi:MAG: NAD(P)H-hydrate epimerase, partial [Gemmatimonadaceae bacterium]
MSVRVVSASQAAELDAAAIAAGVPARSLMQAAGRTAAGLLLARYPLESSRGVAVFAGPGNNGGDAWVLAGELARRGVRVRLAEVEPARTPDAIAEREAASARLTHTVPDGTEGVIVDGLLGTGAHGAPHGAIADAIERIAYARASGAPRVVSLDVPSGVDATTGETPGAYIRAHLTVAFGAMKRGLLVNRDAAGAIIVVDIGLGAGAALGDAVPLMDAAIVRNAVPPISASAHKGTRKRLAILGGAPGMAGSVMLAARGAMRSGIGMVKFYVAGESIPIVQTAEPAAMAARWPQT